MKKIIYFFLFLCAYGTNGQSITLSPSASFPFTVKTGGAGAGYYGDITTSSTSGQQFYYVSSTPTSLGTTTGDIFGSNSRFGLNSVTTLILRTTSLDRMTITPTGNVGIGTSTPTVRFHTLSSRNTASNVPDNVNATIQETTNSFSGLALLSSTGTGLKIYASSTGTMQISNQANTFTPVEASAFNVISDLNVKKEVSNLQTENFGDYLAQIRGIQSATYRYEWEDNQTRKVPHVGFIAQTLPVAVQTEMSKTPGNDTEKVIGYNLSDMAGLTLIGVKALDAEIQRLKQTIVELQAEILKFKK